MVTTSDTSETSGAAARAVGSGNFGPARPMRANPTTDSSLRRRLLRAVLCLIAGTTGLFGCAFRADAQTQTIPVACVPFTDVRAALESPVPTTAATEFADVIDAAAAEGATGSHPLLSDSLPPNSLTGGEMDLLDMIRESMFGNQKDSWKGMPLSTFFSEGWHEPWYYYPRSTTGAPRQAWINAYDGIFYRL
jgi:hypothetical protein